MGTVEDIIAEAERFTKTYAKSLKMAPYPREDRPFVHVVQIKGVVVGVFGERERADAEARDLARLELGEVTVDSHTLL